MVTHDEEHSTRGRANLLRAALSGAMPQEEFSSERMYEALDLCIECKACKAECPSSVDMARIKFEFLANYYEVHSVPLPVRFFANIAFFSRLASGPLAPLINWSTDNTLVRWGLEKFMGIDRRRTLPKFAPVPFTTWFKNRKTKPAQTNQKQVVLFNDTFNTYNDPEIAIAATEVLEAAGFSVILPGHGCCGRPMMSKGLVNEAKANAAATVAKLAPYANRGLPIVGLEPSCVSALRDDYLALLPGSIEAKMVAEMALTFEEFIAKLADEPDFNLPFHTDVTHILLHGHCHQKALIGTEPAKKVLGLVGDCTVGEVDSGCCGMAGAFGYEAEHYDISLAMAERKLLPAIRQVDETSLVVAAGTSCRHQIMHGTGRTALHPAQVLQQALNGKRTN
jgi:Fe-S oxidoreductase